uniref:Peptidase metallopeptidase domain-containing protein n=1 Tax=Clastoptera arizonana TaxID=38151 RepID=A0A1B6E667_9HEMI
MTTTGLVRTLLLGVVLSVVVAAPLRRNDNDYDVMIYLTKFGYLPQSDLETGYLRTVDQLTGAIKTLQRFGNIPQTGVVDRATQQLLAKPRCGLSDLPDQNRRRKRYLIHPGPKWKSTNLTWSLRTEHLEKLDHGRVRSDLSQALQVWAQHSKLTFREINSNDADILIYFFRGYHNDGYPFDGPGRILAHAFFPGTGRGGDVHFDEEEIWLTLHSPMGDEGTSLFAVAAHEFGHSLGLSHSSVKGALMYPWYQGLSTNIQLPDDDRFAIQQIYGAKEKLWGKIPNYSGPRDQDPYRPRVTYKPRITTTTTTTTPRPRPPPKKPYVPLGIPDTCDTSYDAIAVIRGETFIFKDKYLWRIGDKGLHPGYPVLIKYFWRGLPSNLTHIDAVYERSDRKIVFFIGNEYFVLHGTTLMGGYPKPITNLGLPESLDHIDAAMVWGHNGKTYFFSGTMFWRFDEEVGHVELDYPRDMAIWGGVGYYIDTAFQWKNGKTYFFKGKGFWQFKDINMKVENPRQTLSAPFWMGCPKTDKSVTKTKQDNSVNDKSKYELSASSYTLANTNLVLSSLFLFYLMTR